MRQKSCYGVLRATYGDRLTVKPHEMAEIATQKLPIKLFGEVVRR